MKKRILSVAVLLIFVLSALVSCQNSKDVLENMFIAVTKLDVEKAESYVADSGKDYFKTVKTYAEKLSEEQKKTAEKLYSFFEFSYVVKDTDDADHFHITMKYVDFSALTFYVEEQMAVGTGSATEYISELIETGSFSARFVKTESEIIVSLTEENGKMKIPVGYTGENSVFTTRLGLDTFLRWYSGQK